MWRAGGTYSALLWQLGTENEPLQELAELSGHTGVIRRVAWCEQNQQALVSLEEAHIRCWSLREGSVQVQPPACKGSRQKHGIWSKVWSDTCPRTAAVAQITFLQHPPC